MIKLRNRILILTIACLIGLLQPVSASFGGDENPLSPQYKESVLNDFLDAVKDFFGFGIKPSQWSDVKSWKLVGDRFAAAYDQDAKFIAMYDLSYPELLSGITLGQIGHPQAKSADLLQAWNQGQAHLKNLPSDVQAAIKELGDTPEAVFKAADLPEDWWKTLPWKGKLAPMAAPDSFRITDLDQDQLQIGSDILSGLRQLLQVVLDDQTDSLASVSDSELLGSFQFVRSSEGAYKITWTDPRLVSVESRPRKLLDFKSTRNGFYDNIKVEALAAALGEGVSYIPVPIVAALVATAISRVSRYYTMTQTEHLDMLRELMVETGEGSIVDPTVGALSSDDAKTLVDAFVWTAVTPVDVWDWLFSNPDAGWAKSGQSDSTCAASSTQWLSTHGNSIEALNARFSITMNQGSKFLYLNTDPCPVDKTDGPNLSIDYAYPYEAAVDRAFMELVGVGVEFASHLIPTFGSLVNEAYSLLVQDPIDNTQYVESRLMQHLESRAEQGAWDNELTILRAQRMNPFEITRNQMDQLIMDRRKMMGL